MTDTYTFFLVLAAIYFSDCLALIHAHAVCLTSTWGIRWRWSLAPRLIGNANGGIRLNQPLPPLGTLFLTRLWPVSLSPEHVVAYAALCPNPEARPRQSGTALAMDEIQSVEVENGDIVINGARFARAGSPRLAHHLASLIKRVSSLPLDQRAAAIKSALAESFDAASVRSAVKIFNRQAVPLRFFCNLLFGLLFVIAPLAVLWVGLGTCWWILLGALILNLMTIAATFRHAHKTLYPNEVADRRTRMAVLLLNPLAAVRAVDALSRQALIKFHPLAAVSVLCNPARSRAFARLVLTDAVYPALLDDSVTDEIAFAALEWHRMAFLESAVRFLSDSGISPEELLAPDPPAGPSCRTFCPRCREQFEQLAGSCDRCAIPLTAYR